MGRGITRLALHISAAFIFAYDAVVYTPRISSDRLDVFWQCGAEQRDDKGGKSKGRGENVFRSTPAMKKRRHRVRHGNPQIFEKNRPKRFMVKKVRAFSNRSPKFVFAPKYQNSTRLRGTHSYFPRLSSRCSGIPDDPFSE